MTKTPGQIARHIEAQKQVKRRERWLVVRRPVEIVAAFLIGTIVGQPVLTFLWPSPKARIEVSGIRDNDCVYYSLMFSHTRSIEWAEISVRFPNKLEKIHAGVPENFGTSPEHDMRALVGDLITIGKCDIGTGGNVLDDSMAVTKITGNTATIHVSRLSGALPFMGGIMSDANQSMMQPAPAKIEFTGEYSYTLFGMSVSKPIEFVNRGVLDPQHHSN